MLWIQYRNNVEKTDKNFRPLKEQNQEINPKETTVLRYFQKAYLISLIPISLKKTQGYEIIKNGKNVYFDIETFKLFNSKYSDADQIFDAYNTQTQVKKEALDLKKLTSFRGIFNVLSIILILVLFFVSIFSFADKNFSTEKKIIKDVSELKEGDYVEINANFIDAYEIYTTSSRSKTEKKDGFYSLAWLKEDGENFDNEVFIVSSEPNTALTNELDQSLKVVDKDQIIFHSGKIQGEVKNVSKIQKLDQKEQVTDYFKETTDALEVEPAKFFIDTKVQQISFVQAAIFPFLVIIGFLGAVIANRIVDSKIKNKIKQYYNL